MADTEQLDRSKPREFCGPLSDIDLNVTLRNAIQRRHDGGGVQPTRSYLLRVEWYPRATG